MLAIFWTKRDFWIISDIHSITNLKTYEQAKNLVNPANAQSSSEESLKENFILLLVCAPFSLGWICKCWIYVIDNLGASQPSQTSKTFTKRSILHVWQGSRYASGWHIETCQIEQMYDFDSVWKKVITCIKN